MNRVRTCVEFCIRYLVFLPTESGCAGIASPLGKGRGRRGDIINIDRCSFLYAVKMNEQTLRFEREEASSKGVITFPKCIHSLIRPSLCPSGSVAVDRRGSYEVDSDCGLQPDGKHVGTSPTERTRPR